MLPPTLLFGESGKVSPSTFHGRSGKIALAQSTSFHLLRLLSNRSDRKIAIFSCPRSQKSSNFKTKLTLISAVQGLKSLQNDVRHSRVGIAPCQGTRNNPERGASWGCNSTQPASGGQELDATCHWHGTAYWRVRDILTHVPQKNSDVRKISWKSVNWLFYGQNTNWRYNKNEIRIFRNWAFSYWYQTEKVRFFMHGNVRNFFCGMCVNFVLRFGQIQESENFCIFGLTTNALVCSSTAQRWIFWVNLKNKSLD